MVEVSERDFRELVLKTMDAAIDEDCWPEVLRTLAAVSGGIGGILVGCSTAEPSNGQIVNGGLDPNIGRLFIERYQNNPWTRAIAARHDDGAFDLQALVDPRVVRATSFYADVLKPQEMATMTGLVLPSAPGIETGGVSVAFNGRDDSAPRASIKLLNALAPYLRRAITANLHLRAAAVRAAGLAAALDAMPNAALLLSQQSRVLFANRRAETILAAADGLRVLDGELCAARSTDARLLRRMVGDAGRAAQGVVPRGPDALAVARPSGRRALSVLVSPVAELRDKLALRDRPAALLIVTDPDDEAGIAAGAADRLRLLFGLTPTEAGVAVRVARGCSGPEAAAALGIGAGTVHAHLKSVFAKTGVHRQSGLARLLSRTGVLDLA